ncbi:MAG: hypothetical protein GY801_50740 [bacterium]|nr:hypothetical protein [bacterium]
MIHLTIDIEETDYKYLERAAKSSGVTVQLFLKQLITRQQRFDPKGYQEELISPEETKPKKSRWAELSERIRKDPPLTEAGEYVRQTSKEFREDFALSHDEA